MFYFYVFFLLSLYALAAFIIYKCVYWLLNAIEPKEKPFNKTLKLLIPLTIAVASVVIWVKLN